ETITNDPDGVITMGLGEFDNKIHGDGLPGTVGDVERFEQTIGFVSGNLDMVANIAGCNISTDVCVNAGPRVAQQEFLERQGAARVSANDGIMELFEDFVAEWVRYENTAFVEHNVVLHSEIFIAFEQGFTPFGVGVECVLKSYEEF
ncbi:hypothetical protein FA15DRAFT_589629, partial [Coprinopsis marcescibilis]